MATKIENYHPMLNFKIIGCGGAGNKAAADMINYGLVSHEDILMMNSNFNDIPHEYQNICGLLYGQKSYGGSGKDRSRGRQLLINDMRIAEFNSRIDKFCSDVSTDVYVIIGSSEGGSGSSALPVLAKYIRQALNKRVIVAIFFGFEEDVHGIENSVGICKDLTDDIGVIGISNKKFLPAANGNKTVAEKMANAYLNDALLILNGSLINPSAQNIDKTDLMKIVCTPGYITACSCNIHGIKNRQQFDDAIRVAADNTRYMDSAERKKCVRIGAIYDLKNPDTASYVDFRGNELRSRYGTPYEYFQHIQHKTSQDLPETVTWIVTGQELPIEALESLYNRYKEESAAIDRDNSEFFKFIGGLSLDDNSQQFDVLSSNNTTKTTNEKKRDFFAEYDEGKY